MAHARLLAFIPLIAALAAASAPAQAEGTPPRYGDAASCSAAASNGCKRFTNPVNFNNCHQLVFDACMTRNNHPRH